jgi:Leucine-rich repeat (LRR) protein
MVDISTLPMEIQRHIVLTDIETFFILYSKEPKKYKWFIKDYCKMFNIENSIMSLYHYYLKSYIKQDAFVFDESYCYSSPYRKDLTIVNFSNTKKLSHLYPNLEKLTLTSCIEFGNEVFKNLKHLNIFTSSIENFENKFPKLEKLIITRGNVECLNNIQNLKQLTKFEAMFVNLIHFPYMFHENLQELNLENNSLEYFCGNFPNLKILNLSRNSLKSIDVSKCKKISRMDVSHNFLNFLHVSNDNLKYIDAGNNIISRLYLDTPNLKKLYIDYNRIRDLAKSYIVPLSLKMLDVAFNEIEHLDEIIFFNLEKLNISHNEIKLLPDLPPSLKELNIAYTMITNIKNFNPRIKIYID